MINIIARPVSSQPTRGPDKVVRNLAKGLDLIGYPYVFNHDLKATRRVWLPNQAQPLFSLSTHRPGVVAGPSLWSSPQQVPAELLSLDVLYVVPSNWVRDLWGLYGFAAWPVRVWPAGVDLDECRPVTHLSRKHRVLIYHKDRDPHELATIMDAVLRVGLEPRLVLYGRYSQEEFLEELSTCRAAVWHAARESQGLAMLEALGCGVPTLVWDVSRLHDAHGGFVFGPETRELPVTSAPYFDARCGLIVHAADELQPALERVVGHAEGFAPREYVRENLSLEKQAHAFLTLFDEWGWSPESGRSELAATSRRFSPGLRYGLRTWSDRLRRRLGASWWES